MLHQDYFIFLLATALLMKHTHPSLNFFLVGVGNDKTKAFKTFNIDLRSKTSFEVANALWDHIGEGIDSPN